MKITPLFRFLDPAQSQSSAHSAQYEWLLDNRLEHGLLAEFVTRLQGRSAVLVVPGEAVSLRAVQIPGRSRATRLKALPYVLEDSIVDDVENLHLALDDASLSTMTTVAIVRRTRLQDWLQICREAGVALSAIVPDMLLLPDDEKSWSILLDGERALLRCGKSSGFVCERGVFLLLLKMALREAGENTPELIKVFHTPDESFTGDDFDEIQALGVAVQPQTAPLAEGVLSFLATCYDKRKTLDLLQGAGAFQPRTQLSAWLQPWRATAVLAGLWLIVQGGIQIIDYWRLSRKQAELAVTIEQVFKEAIPTARRIVNPRVQLTTRLEELRRGQSHDDAAFFQLLRHGSQTLNGFDDVSLRGLRYTDQQLDMDLEGGSPQQLDQLRQRLSSDPAVQAEMRTSKNNGKIESRIILRRGAS